MLHNFSTFYEVDIWNKHEVVNLCIQNNNLFVGNVAVLSLILFLPLI